ncbi:hypothetical protein CED96_22750 [Salmonella enterica subsp. enterica serovar Kentucky]|nr:hypothetical protein [Salmonella enterica subsp. enterica serovar Kentucky]
MSPVRVIFAFVSAIYGLLSALLLKTAGTQTCLLHVIFLVVSAGKILCMHQSTVTSLLFGSPLCERGDDLGTEQWALAGNGLINFELAANQERSNPSNVTCLSLITVLKEWVNIIVLLHNLLTGERVTL